MAVSTLCQLFEMYECAIFREKNFSQSRNTQVDSHSNTNNKIELERFRFDFFHALFLFYLSLQCSCFVNALYPRFYSKGYCWLCETWFSFILHLQLIFHSTDSPWKVLKNNAWLCVKFLTFGQNSESQLKFIILSLKRYSSSFFYKINLLIFLIMLII